MTQTTTPLSVSLAPATKLDAQVVPPAVAALTAAQKFARALMELPDETKRRIAAEFEQRFVVRRGKSA